MTDITPSDVQASAIKSIVDWYKDKHSPQEFYLAGYAGTGKSTCAALALAELQGRKVLTGAYTGKAAFVLRKKGVDNAQTLHSMLYTLDTETDDGEPRFVLNSVGPASEADMILVDEASMVDNDMADDIRSFGKKILVMGDPGQLPPVKGKGAMTNRTPDVFLREIHRQAESSPILRLATLARQGMPIPVGDYGDDVRVMMLDQRTQHEIHRPGTQILCGVHRVRWTVTKRIRRKLGYDDDCQYPLEGERILCCRNNREQGIFNGQLGTMLDDADVDTLDPYYLLNVELEDRNAPLYALKTHPYLFNQHFSDSTERPKIYKGIHEFDWGYVLTVHKSQGSEWPHVTVIDDSASFREDAAKHLYTAITRASEGLTLLLRGGRR